MRYLIAVVFWLSVCSYLHAQQSEPAASSPEPVPGVPDQPVQMSDPFSRENLDVFIDGLFSSQFEAYHLAGAVIVIVKDDAVLLSKGYGYADLRTGRAIDPASTLLHIGDVSKLFVWTAFMQLSEQGRLDLNRDVNTYLKRFKVPDDYPEPVTAADLMAHTAGFEARFLRTLLPTFSDLRPLEQTLAADFPKRVRPPGAVAAYSDYGAALGALMVEDITGQSWADYLSTRILNPLGMSRTSISQPLEPGSAQDQSHGYFFSGGRLERGEFEIVRLPSALGMTSTGEDMGRFLIANLQAEDGLGDRIMQPETLRTMHSELHSQDSRLPGMAHGFVIRQLNGQRVVGHTGGLLNFHSGLWMLPGQKAGFFVAYNSADGARAQVDFTAALIDHWYPRESGQVTREPVGFPGRAQLITGTYLPTRRPFTTIDKVSDWLEYGQVRVAADGMLLTELPGRGPQEWLEYEPFAFREFQGRTELVFKVDSGGGRTLLLLGDGPELVFEKLPRYESPEFHIVLLSVSALLFLSTLIFPMVRWLLVRRTDEMLARRDATHPLVRSLASLLSLVNVLFLGGLIYLFRDPLIFLGEVPLSLSSLLLLSVLSGALTLILMIVTFFAWRGHYWRFAARVHYTLVMLAAVAFLWELNYWNLLGWRF